MNSANRFADFVGTLLLAAAAWFAVPVSANSDSLSAVNLTEQLKQELHGAVSATDSIAILYNIFDLSPYNDRLVNIKRLYNVAVRANNVTVQLDMLRHWANVGAYTYNDSLARAALVRAEKLPDSEEQRQTCSFIKACLSTAMRNENEEALNRRLHALLQDWATDPVDNIYERVERLFMLTHAIGGRTQGALLSEYLDQLGEAISRLPESDTYALRNKFYTDAAIAYWRNDEPQKSLDADRRLLAIIDEMEDEYRARGRVYRNYDINRYVSLRRMLRNYRYLTVEQVDSINDALLHLTEVNDDIRKDYFLTNPMPRAIALVKHGDYAAALPLVRQLVDKYNDVYERRYYLAMLREVADKVGDLGLQKEADEAYITTLEEFVRFKTAERTRELQILYDVDNLRRESSETAFERQRARALYSSVAVIVLLALLIPLVALYVRFRHQSRQLKAANASLKAERGNLLESRQNLVEARDKSREAEAKKTELLNYIGHEVITPLSSIVEYAQMIVDNVPDQSKPYLKRFCSVVETNTVMLQEIVADVQEYVRLESNTLQLHVGPVDINAVARIAVDNIRPQLADGVELRLIPDAAPHPVVATDRRRVEVVLMTLLSNSAKFTSQGSITLTCERRDGEAVFTVEDTGSGLPPALAKRLFEKFDPSQVGAEGSGMGLPVCAMIARALGGSIALDSAYGGPGSRFVFTVPSKSKSPKA